MIENETEETAAGVEESSETKSEQPRKKSGFSHTVRHKDGGTVTINNYTMLKAIKLNCSECEGFENDPRKCTVKLCPLFPFRSYTMANRSRSEFKSHLTPEQIEKNINHLRFLREQKAAANTDHQQKEF